MPGLSRGITVVCGGHWNWMKSVLFYINKHMLIGSGVCGGIVTLALPKTSNSLPNGVNNLMDELLLFVSVHLRRPSGSSAQRL